MTKTFPRVTLAMAALLLFVLTGGPQMAQAPHSTQFPKLTMVWPRASSHS